jgi:predicted acetyltransferase
MSKETVSNVSIREFSVDDGERERRFLLTIPEDENGFQNPANPDDLANEQAFRAFLQRSVDRSRGIGLPDGYVPDTTYWIDRGGEVVGVGKIRHHLTDALREAGGHIGFGGIPQELRGQGIAGAALGLLVPEARRLIGQYGEEDMLLTVDEDNIGSRKVIEKNGGVVDKIIGHSGRPGVREVLYWIRNDQKGDK